MRGRAGREEERKEDRGETEKLSQAEETGFLRKAGGKLGASVGGGATGGSGVLPVFPTVSDFLMTGGAPVRWCSCTKVRHAVTLELQLPLQRSDSPKPGPSCVFLTSAPAGSRR